MHDLGSEANNWVYREYAEIGVSTICRSYSFTV